MLKEHPCNVRSSFDMVSNKDSGKTFSYCLGVAIVSDFQPINIAQSYFNAL